MAGSLKIKVSPMLIIMAFALTFFGFGTEFISYFLTIIIHEMAHAEVSKKFGYCLNEIKLTPYGASLTGMFEGVKRSHDIIIALAGPVINIIIAVVCIALWWLIPSSYLFTEYFVMCNIFNACFNLLPIFPLDGGRAVLAFFSKWIKREKVYRIMRTAGIFAAIIFCGLFIATIFYGINFSLATIAVFIFSSTIIPDKNSKYQRLYSMAYRTEKLKTGLQVKEIMVSEDATIIALLRMLNANYYHRFIVMDKGFKKAAEISETQLESIASKCDNTIPVMEVLRKIT